MRTIKFRGKRLDGRGWVVGWYETYKNGVAAFIGNYSGITDIPTIYKVLPESVGQWTGLVDRHGKEIYEGDVITNGVFKRVVEFTDGGYYPFTSTVGAFYPDECEVIRSIHDNPRTDGGVIMTQEKKLESCLRQIDGAVDILIPHIKGNTEAEQAVRTIIDASFSLSFLLDELMEVE